VPPAEEYNGFPQVENGVGMVRQLLDEAHELRRTSEVCCTYKPATLVCGTLIAPVMEQIVDEMNALTSGELRLVSVVNGFFGPVTTVSGLLTGEDVLAALRGRTLGDLVLLPRAMFTGRYGAGSTPPGMTLDDISLADISAQLAVPVRMAGTITEALAHLSA
jgi:NifB/MoaA-like Fe-S oxidoreductase